MPRQEARTPSGPTDADNGNEGAGRGGREHPIGNSKHVEVNPSQGKSWQERQWVAAQNCCGGEAAEPGNARSRFGNGCFVIIAVAERG